MDIDMLMSVQYWSDLQDRVVLLIGHMWANPGPTAVMANKIKCRGPTIVIKAPGINNNGQRGDILKCYYI